MSAKTGQGKLCIVATPIGNLGDMTPRALEALDAADCICAEDTRVTGKLLSAFGISNKLERCDENVIGRRAAALVERMQAGETIAFCSDAGMPGISDPGLVLVDACRDAGIAVEVLPGASAVTAAVAAAGFNTQAFYFGGFLPRKHKTCAELLQALAPLDAALVFYESPHRVTASLRTIADVLGTRRVALCRELTKLHEEVVRLPAPQLLEALEARPSIKGELVLVIEPPVPAESAPSLDDPALHERIRAGLEQGTSKSALAKELARDLGMARSDIYDLILKLA